MKFVYKFGMIVGISSFLILSGCKKEEPQEIITETTTTEAMTEETEKQFSLNYADEIYKIVQETTPIARTKIDKAIELTKNKDYSYNSIKEILGTPSYILETYDTQNFYIYKQDEIDEMLNQVLSNTKYNEDSFVELDWVGEDDMILSTYISLDLKEELKITGFVYQYIDVGGILDSHKLNSTSVGLSEIETIDRSLDELEDVLGANLFCYREQYPMLFDSAFIQSRMDEDSANLTSKNYCIKVEKGNSLEGYLMIETFEGIITNIYEIYEDNSNLPIVDDATADKIKNSKDMTKADFLELVPNSIKLEITRSSFDQKVSTKEYYGFIKESDKDNYIVTKIQIVDDIVIDETPEF